MLPDRVRSKPASLASASAALDSCTRGLGARSREAGGESECQVFRHREVGKQQVVLEQDADAAALGRQARK